MSVMERDLEFQVSSDLDGTEPVVNNETTETNMTDLEDDRIPVTNGQSLDKILQITMSKATNVAQSHKDEESKSKFVARFTEMFCDILRSNVCIEGLPWSVQSDLLSNVQDREQQQIESEDARLSKLSKEVEKVAKRRRHAAKECMRIREMRLKHQRQNLRKLNMDCPALVSSPDYTPLPETFPHEELAQICEKLNAAQATIQRIDTELPTLEKNFEMAQDILKRQKVLLDDDTGYMSS